METAEKKESHNLTTGAIGPQLWSLAWPMMLSVFFYTLYNLVDAYWVSKLSADAIAAVSISQISLFLMISLGFGVTAGSGVVMSMDIGAKNTDEAERVLGQSFVLTSILAVVFTAFALVFREQLLTLSGASGSIFEPAMEYFTVIAVGSILMFLLMTVMFSFNAQGDTFTLTKLFAVSTLVNLVLDPILIFGWMGFPALGISGAAWATLFSQLVFIVIALRSLSSPKRSIRFRVKNLTFRWESVKKVLRIGIPAALTQILNPVGLAALTFISSLAFAESGAIAMSLGFRVEFFAYLPAVGYGFAAMAMMGQSIGAENLERAKDVLRKAIRYGGITAFGFGLVVALFAPQIIAAFTTDPEVTGYTLLYMRTVAFSYVFIAAMLVEASAFQAVGKSWPGFWIIFLRFIIISIPLAYLFTVVWKLPILWLWLSIIIGNVIAAIVGYFWLWSKLKNFDFKEVEETVHMHG